MNTIPSAPSLNVPPVTNPPAGVANPEDSSLPDNQLWTTEQVSLYLHVSLKTVFNLRKQGLPYVQLGGAVRFVPQEIRAYLVNSRGLSAHRRRQMVRKGGVR